MTSDGKIILKLHIKEEGCGLDSFVLEQRPLAISCESGNEPAGSIKAGEFLD